MVGSFSAVEKYLMWYFIQLKQTVKSRICWLQIAVMAFLIFIVTGINIPSESNVCVGVYNGSGVYAQQIIDNLTDYDGIFEFEQYKNEDMLYSDVKSGKIECGFAFKADFDEKLLLNDIKHQVVYAATPFSTKGAVIRETFYSVMLKSMSGFILTEAQGELFDGTDVSMTEYMLNKNNMFMENESILHINFNEVETVKKGVEKKYNVYPVHGVLGIFIFFSILMEYGKKFNENGRGFLKAITKQEKCIFEYTGCVSAATPLAVVAIIIVEINGGRGILSEIFMMSIFILWSSMWVILFGGVFKNSSTYASWIMIIILTNVIICPVFWNIEKYVPSLHYLSKLFPVGVFLSNI